MKESREIKVQVSGQGKTKNEAFSSALNQIQKTILKQHDQLILRIEPVDIEVLKSEYNEKTERFLFLFFPRVKTNYFVSLEVTVDVTLFSLEDVDFKLIQ